MGVKDFFGRCSYALEAVDLRSLPQRAGGRAVAGVDASGWSHRAGKSADPVGYMLDGNYTPAVNSFVSTALTIIGTGMQLLVVFALCAPVQFWLGGEFYHSAAKALGRGSSTMDVLVVLGTTSGFVYSLVSVLSACWAGGEASHFFETSAMLITFVMLGRTLECAAKGEASDAVASLLRSPALAPPDPRPNPFTRR